MSSEKKKRQCLALPYVVMIGLDSSLNLKYYSIFVQVALANLGKQDIHLQTFSYSVNYARSSLYHWETSS